MRKTNMILLLRMIDERCDIDLPAGTIVIPIEDRLDRIAFMMSDGKIVRIRDVSLVEIIINDPSRNAPDPTRKLRIWRDGTKVWYKNGQLHRDAQPGQSPGPAVEYASGTKEWWKNGQLHRSDGPAYEGSNETKEWWKNGQLHRDAQPGQSPGPAIEWADGTKEWYKNGQLHRDAQPGQSPGPAVERADGTKEWYKNGKRCGEPT